MVEIVPAILPQSFADMEAKLAQVHDAVSSVQIDVVDGIFAPNTTWPYQGGERFSSIIAQDEGLPFWEDLDFEFDCMLAHPEKEVPNYISAGASRVVVHSEGKDLRAALETFQKDRAGDLGIALGLALLPGESAATFAQYRELVDFVQVMGIANVGFQGKEFDARAIDLITSLRADNPDLTIQIDGGVNIENARALALAGANRLIVGSAIFKAEDPREAIHLLGRAANR